MPRLAADVAMAFGQIVTVLDRLGPTVLLIDDLDQADPATIAVISALVASGGAESLCVVATRGPLGGATSWSPSAVSHATVRLAALSRDDVEALAVDGLWAETGGHPASIAACLEATHHGGVLSLEATDAVLARVDELGELGRHVLNVASAQPQPFDVEQVAWGARVSREVVVDVVRRGVDAGLLRAIDADRVGFTGELTRRALVAADSARHNLH